MNVAYDVLSTPASKRVYDARPATASMHDFFSARPYADAEETFRGVILGVINDFLEGDLETVRTLLRKHQANIAFCMSDMSERTHARYLLYHV